METIGKKNLPKEWFSEYHIQQVLGRDYMSHPKYVLYNLEIFGWESDFLACTQSGYWYEVEIKISMADFRNDFKNKVKKHVTLEKASSVVDTLRPNYFSYCVPESMVKEVMRTLPYYAGLYCVTRTGRLKCTVTPPKLHNGKYSSDNLNLLQKFYFAYHRWYSKSSGWRDEEISLRARIQWLKAEFKAVSGYNIKEVL
ncbi:MAG: hypothetical protein PUF37_00885 [Prevotellaceae bacterium]|nr:hypothetical protein [Prevotellaceae bacterium]